MKDREQLTSISNVDKIDKYLQGLLLLNCGGWVDDREEGSHGGQVCVGAVLLANDIKGVERPRTTGASSRTAGRD